MYLSRFFIHIIRTMVEGNNELMDILPDSIEIVDKYNLLMLTQIYHCVHSSINRVRIGSISLTFSGFSWNKYPFVASRMKRNALFSLFYVYFNDNAWRKTREIKHVMHTVLCESRVLHNKEHNGKKFWKFSISSFFLCIHFPLFIANEQFLSFRSWSITCTIEHIGRPHIQSQSMFHFSNSFDWFNQSVCQGPHRKKTS